jgi:hypothetical protein
MQAIGLNSNQKLTGIEWSVIKRALLSLQKRRAPRIFSDLLIEEEREKLKKHREIFREIMKQMQHKNFIPDKNGDLSLL